MPFGGQSVGGPSVALQVGGRLGVFVRRADTRMLLWSLSLPDGAWSELSLGGAFAPYDPDASVMAGGGLFVVAQGTDEQLYVNYQAVPGANWAGWSSLGAPPPGKVVGGPACTRATDGSIVVFARDTDTAIWYRGGIALGGRGYWSDWSPLGGKFDSDPDAAVWAGGLLVAALGTDKQLYVNYQPVLGGSWSGWSSLGGPPPGQVLGGPGCARATDGSTAVFVRALSNDIWHRYGIDVAGMQYWSEWRELGGDSVSDPDCAVNAAGGLALVVRGTDDRLRYRGQNFVQEPESPPPVPNPYLVSLIREGTGFSWRGDVPQSVPVPVGARVAVVTWRVPGTVSGSEEWTAVVTHDGYPEASSPLKPNDETFAFRTHALPGTWRAAVVGDNLVAGQTFTLEIVWQP